uniref:Peptidase_M13_N domain-containing protein n=1 Tax=Parastrongyloides trichosuri TaxID=131310 RepID=A0A0N5A354_PARTI
MGRNNLVADTSSNIPYLKLNEKIEYDKKADFQKFIIKKKSKSSKCVFGFQIFFALVAFTMIVAYFTIYVIHPFQYLIKNHYTKDKLIVDEKKKLYLSDIFEPKKNDLTCDPISDFKCKLNGDEAFWRNTTVMLKKYLHEKKAKDIALKETVRLVFDKCLEQTMIPDNKVKHIKQSLNSVHKATDIAFYLSEEPILMNKIYSRNVVSDAIGILDRIFDSKILFSGKLVYSDNVSNNTGKKITSIKALYKISPVWENYDDSHKEDNLKKIIELLRTFGVGNKTFINIAAEGIQKIDQMLNDRLNGESTKNVLFDIKTAKERWSSIDFEAYFLRMTSGNIKSMAHVKSRTFQFIIKNVDFFDRLETLFATGAINQITLGNYVLYKFIVERMQMPGFTTETDCTRLIANSLPLLTLKIYNNELSNYEAEILEEIAEDHVEFTTEALEIVAASTNTFKISDKLSITQKIQNMRLLIGAPRWVFNENHLIKYHETLSISNEDEFNNIVYKLREFSLFKMQESLYREQPVDEYMYVHKKISANKIHYCPITNTLMIPSSALLSLKEQYDEMYPKNNLFNAKIAFQLAKLFTHYDNGYYAHRFLSKIGNKYGPVTKCMYDRFIDLTDIQHINDYEVEEATRYAAAIQIAYVVFKNIQNEEIGIGNDLSHKRPISREIKQKQSQNFFNEIISLYCDIPNEYLRGFTANSLIGFTPYQGAYDCFSTQKIGTCNLWTSFYKL